MKLFVLMAVLAIVLPALLPAQSTTNGAISER